MASERWFEELAARLDLAQGSASLLVVVAESEAVLEGARSALVALLSAVPIKVGDLGECAPNAGPGRWAELSQGLAAEVHLLAAAPPAPFGVAAFAGLVNAERELLRRLSGPLLLLISRTTEQVLRQRAPDFLTWASQVVELPRAEELSAMSRKLASRTRRAGDPQDAGQDTGNTGGTSKIPPRPPPEEPIRFLHLSDLHLRPQRLKRYDQDRVLRGLLQFLEADRARFPLDLVFLTGDLAHGGKADEYALAGEFLRELIDVTGVAPARVFVVPGNHDVDRDVGRWLLRTLSSDEEAVRFFMEEESRRFHAQKLDAYRKSMQALLGADRPMGLGVGAEAVEVVQLRGARIAVASFNTAWFAQADDDQGRLWLGEPSIDGAEGRIADEGASFAIALMHHPFDELHESERWMVERRSERVFDLLLRGHLHQERTRAIASQRGGFVEVAAPAAYQGSQWGNGCFLGEIRPRERSVRLRPYTYASGADPWVLDPKVFPDSADEGYCHTFQVPEKKRLRSTVGESLRKAAVATVLAAPPAARKELEAQLDMLSPPGRAAGDTTERVTKEVYETLRAATVQALLKGQQGGASGEIVQIPRSDPQFLEKSLLQAARWARVSAAASGLLNSVTSHTLEHMFCSALEAVLEGPVQVLSLSQSEGPDVLIGSDSEAPERRAVIELRLEVRGDVMRAALAQLDAQLTAFPGVHAALVMSEVSLAEASAASVERVTTPDGHEVLLLRM
ncbi:metallophosphoesterase family protein [Chondromyces apiculatus]|uniref:Calcineurin-like phosphoesterase domain-containing protein n=1 Tax=Chondromyces apiculatus DSM 436 TaxID=1192034 RepID=A0A017T4M3_9BACT|nr:metallophosphoesterase [Chondromyces apiculatus]EYF03511.1 Hypothetical protein CAP_5495 [Chondromyces apiculatus DSM 436]